MKEAERISRLFSSQWEGASWLGVHFRDTLQGITAKEAASRPFPGFNSIWEILIHLLEWRRTVLRRLQGETIEAPEDNFFSYVSNRSEEAWQQLCRHFEQSTQQVVQLLEQESAATMSRRSTQPPFSRYELIMGMLQHEAYHLGQIRLLHRLAQFRG